MSSSTSTHSQTPGILGWIERKGNQLPDPVFIFLWLIAALVIVSVIASLTGLAVPHPTKLDDLGKPLMVEAQSLLSAANIQRFLVDMPRTFSHFHPLGYVLVVMLGAGVAERSGLFATAMKAGVRKAPKVLLTPIVALVAMMANLAADAAYVVLIPLAGVLYAAAGRHPIAGIAASFAGVSGGFSANLLPGQLDALLFGITEASAEVLVPSWEANIAGNWYFMAALTLVYLPVIWWITDRFLEPRLGVYVADNDYAETLTQADPALSETEKSALKKAGLAVLGVIAVWTCLCLFGGTPLVNESAEPQARLAPLYRSLVAGFFLLFLISGWVYGAAMGAINSHRDVVKMMSDAMSDLAYYLVIAFAAAHFVAMFSWSNLGLIMAINGAAIIESANLSAAFTLTLLVFFTAAVNLFVGSASAKWAILAPVLVPMMMLSGISPEMTTAAYRVGDGATNIITPLMFYLPLILAFAQRWQSQFGLGSMTSTMLPYSLAMLAGGLVLMLVWFALGLPLGPDAPLSYQLLSP